MQITPDQKGKAAEFLVFSELIRKGADLYLPVIDLGIDAIVRKKNGTCLEIQVKSTEEDEQAGYFNVYDLDKHPKDRFFIICVDMNKNRAKEKGKPNIWVIPVDDFKKYMVSGYQLPIYARSRQHKNELRSELLKNRFRAWELLTE